mgnify:CR=1 FL=1
MLSCRASPLFISISHISRCQPVYAFKALTPWAKVAPAFKAAATKMASAISSRTAPAFFPAFVCRSMQYGQPVVCATATAISSFSLPLNITKSSWVGPGEYEDYDHPLKMNLSNLNTWINNEIKINFSLPGTFTRAKLKPLPIRKRFCLSNPLFLIFQTFTVCWNWHRFT